MSDAWAPRAKLIPIVLGVLAALWTFSWTHAYGLFGFDSYPILLTSRVRSVSDFLGNFTEELMDGRFTGHFYRPVLNLSFALDAALWKLHPAGYQWTNAVLFGACVAITFVLTRRILGPRAWIGPSIATAAFFLHPTHVEVIPVPARRPEILAWLFSAGALAMQLAVPAKASRRRAVLPVILALAAMLSKETAFILPFWIGIALLARDRNLRSALSEAWPHGLALALALMARLLVLHGLGGYGETLSGTWYGRIPSTWLASGKLLLMPQPPLLARVAGIPLMVLLSLALVAGGGVLLRWYRSSHRGSHPGRAVLVGVSWLLAVGASYAFAGRVESWYLLLMVGGWSLVLGGMAEAGWLAFQNREFRGRLLGALTIATVGLLVMFPARLSPFLYRYREWDESAVRSREFLRELDRRVENAADGTAIPSPPIPRWAKVQPTAIAVRGAALFSGVTMQAYFELAYPPRIVRLAQRPGQVPGPREVLVIPTGLAPGFDGP